MELNKVLEGFTVNNTLVIKAQVQVIRWDAERPLPKILKAWLQKEAGIAYICCLSHPGPISVYVFQTASRVPARLLSTTRKLHLDISLITEPCLRALGCRDRLHMPFRCLDAQYRRELVRVYLTNVETICRKFVDEKRESLALLREDGKGFRHFLGSLDPSRKRNLASEKGEVVMKVRSSSRWRHYNMQ